STKLPSSSNASMRSRAVSLPASCCLSMRALPPASVAFASIASRRRIGSTGSWLRVTWAAYSRRVADVKGSALAYRVSWVQLGHGAAGMNKLLAACTPALREAIESGVKMARWYPFEQFIELNEVIDRTFGRGDLSLVRQLGRHGADANLTTIY